VREAVTNYLTLASGLTEVTRKRATAAAKALVAQGEATVEQVSGLAEEIVETSRSNRAALVNLMRYEIDRTLSRLGMATADEVTALRGRIAELERQLAEAQAASATPAEATTKAAGTKRASAKAAGAKTAGARTAGTKAAGTKAAGAKAAGAKTSRRAAGTKVSATRAGGTR
jgi:polyhydroxyalkanoate synthesis regulator phasin